VLSVEQARRHYPETVLYTDDEGAAMLVDGLGLAFTQVSTELNALRDADPEWWTLGKLMAYRAQSRPFVHLDNDVFLWNALPSAVVSASVFAQTLEIFPFDGGSWYRPKIYDDSLQRGEGWAPDEWKWYVSRTGNEALCCGILGGQRADFISYYAGMALKFLTHPKNQRIWSSMEHKVGDNILFEQYFLSACLAYYRQHDRIRFGALEAACLFQSTHETYHSNRAIELGYTHLIGGAKKNEAFAAHLENRVARDYPALYERCLRHPKAAFA
jgi:hypothetical protein